MLFVVVAIALFILWPESRPFIVGLVILTIIGVALTANQRRQARGPLRGFVKPPPAYAAPAAAYSAALEREDYDAARRILASNPDFAAYQDAKRAAFLDVVSGTEQAESDVDSAARTRRSEAAKKGAATRRARREQRLEASLPPTSTTSVERIPSDRPGSRWPPSE